MANAWEIDAGMGRGSRNTPWQWRTTWGKLGTDFQGYKDWLFQQPHAELDRASEITGVPKEQIVQAAEMLARPVNGRRPKTSFGLEKGNYWSNNYGNTASFAALALICGAGNRPGQVISRLGGHQRGWMGASPYPIDKSPNRLPGRRRQEIDLDRWVEAGQVRFSWVIGTTWINAMAASQELYQTFVRMTTGNPHQVSTADVDQAAETLIRRADSGGMVIVDQDIYLQRPIGDELADIVLPAATSGRLQSLSTQWDLLQPVFPAKAGIHNSNLGFLPPPRPATRIEQLCNRPGRHLQDDCKVRERSCIKTGK